MFNIFEQDTTRLLSKRWSVEHGKVKMNLPRIGHPAPVFKGKAILGDRIFDVSLKDYAGKYLVLLFFPMDFAYVCPTELIAFSNRLDEFHDINTDVIACAVESHLTHLRWVNTPRKEGGLRGINIPLIADKAMSITTQYGVLKEDEGISFRAMFIIDDQSNLRQITINDRPVGRSVDETFRVIKILQEGHPLHESTSESSLPESSPKTVARAKPRFIFPPEKTPIRNLVE